MRAPNRADNAHNVFAQRNVRGARGVQMPYVPICGQLGYGSSKNGAEITRKHYVIFKNGDSGQLCINTVLPDLPVTVQTTSRCAMQRPIGRALMRHGGPADNRQRNARKLGLCLRPTINSPIEIHAKRSQVADVHVFVRGKKAG